MLIDLNQQFANYFHFLSLSLWLKRRYKDIFLILETAPLTINSIDRKSKRERKQERLSINHFLLQNSVECPLSRFTLYLIFISFDRFIVFFCFFIIQYHKDQLLRKISQLIKFTRFSSKNLRVLLQLNGEKKSLALLFILVSAWKKDTLWSYDWLAVP